MEEKAKEGGFSILVGKTLTKVEGMEKGSEVVDLYTSDGEHFRMQHDQDCCECVEVEDVVGDVEDILNTPVLSAYESTQDGGGDYDNTSTWTFYRLQTIKGSLVLRWLGESNGYYSEGVDFFKVENWN